MADYVMLEDIFETTENMTVLRDNSYNDDGTDTVAGVDWFKFRETIMSLYVPIVKSLLVHMGIRTENIAVMPAISRTDSEVQNNE